MTDVIAKLATDVAKTVWAGVEDVFSSAGGALVAIVVAIILSIVPVWLLCLAAVVLFGGILYSQYKETIDNDSKE